MPTYRVYFAERDSAPRAGARSLDRESHFGSTDSAAFSETEWEEEVEGKNEAGALDAFFREHVRDRSDLMWVDDNGDSHRVEGVGDYEPEKTYIWLEDGKMMEYQGLDESTPGMVTCPLCDGAGEVDEETADEFLAAYEEGEAKEPTWG